MVWKISSKISKAKTEKDQQLYDILAEEKDTHLQIAATIHKQINK